MGRDLIEQTLMLEFLILMFLSTNHRLWLSSCYCNHENENKRAYEQPVREVEHGSLLFWCSL